MKVEAHMVIFVHPLFSIYSRKRGMPDLTVIKLLSMSFNIIQSEYFIH